ncbi:MAG: HDOD domain-containing protein [Syntrophobacteraceae bacterium]
MAERSIDYWVERLSREDMPLFSCTVQHVAGMATKENFSFSELAWSILQDPVLTSRVLKLANSMYYNPSAKRILTVSRAVMRLGTNIIKEICLAISLIESVLSGVRKEKVAVEVARSFHAAVQARRMAILLKVVDAEEIFIAALLARIGNIAFWCFADEMGPSLENAMHKSGSDELAEVEVLGFKLERLTERLSQEWKLSDLLERSLRSKNDADPRVRSIRLGCAVALAAEKGWDSPQMRKTIGEVSNFFRLSGIQTTEILHESAKKAAAVTELFGTKTISRLVPIPEKESCGISKPGETLTSLSPTGLAIMDTPSEAQYPKPDLSVQMGSLRDLSALMSSGAGEFNMVLSIVLEGIYRGIGMDRVVFGLLVSDRRSLRGKHGLGCLEGDWVDSFAINVGSDTENVFEYVLKTKKSLWVTEKPEDSVKRLLTEELVNLIGNVPFFVMPVIIKDVAIGVIYADRKSSGRKLDEESFENFNLFGQQTNMCLRALAYD